MNNRMKRIVLLTSNFPYGCGETFLEPEIPYLSRAAAEVHILPVNDLSPLLPGQPRALPGNVTVRLDLNHDLQKRLQQRVPRLTGALFDGRFRQALFQEISKMRLLAKRKRGTIFPYFTSALSSWSVARIVKETLYREFHNSMEGTLFYSYWFYDGALALGLLRETVNACRCVSRAHRADLYEERRPLAYHPFTCQKIQLLDRLFLISTNGYEYLSSRYSELTGKLELSRIGVSPQETAPWSPSAHELRLVSCSAVTPVKRLSLLLEALSLCNFPVSWAHIGSGPLLEEYQTLAAGLPANIHARFLGQLTNSEVREHYLSQPYDLFVNVSEHEGLPVSIMEAQCAGIPVMAADTGGNRELVNTKNGFLLPPNPAPEHIANILKVYSHLSATEQQEKRSCTRETWERFSNAKNQYPRFIESLEGLFRLER